MDMYELKVLALVILCTLAGILLLFLSMKGIVWFYRRMRASTPMLMIPNYCGFFTHAPTGKVATKCMKLGWRCLFLLMRNGDGIVVAKSIAVNFREYFRKVRGFEPLIYEVNAEEPLDIIAAIMKDEELCEQLRLNGKRARWTIFPLIQHPKVFELAKKLNLKVAGTPAHLVGQSLIMRLNSKVIFAKWMMERSYTVAGQPCDNTTQMYEMAYAHFRSAYSADPFVVRADISAGGLGNFVFNSIKEVESFISSLSASKDKTRHNSPLHTRAFTCMAGPYMNVHHHVSVMFEVNEKGGKILTTCHRRLKGGVESVGGTIPAPRFTGMDIAIWTALEYAKHLAETGYRGVADIDYGLTGGAVICFESNARFVLTSVPYNIRNFYINKWKLRSEAKQHPETVTVFYDESPPVGNNGGYNQEHIENSIAIALERFEEVPGSMRAQIVLVSPPDPDTGWYSLAYVIERTPASSRDLLMLLKRTFEESLAQPSLKTSQAPRAPQRDYFEQ